MKLLSSIFKKTTLLFILVIIIDRSNAQVRTAIDFKVQLDTNLYVKTVPLEALNNVDSLSIIKGYGRITSFKSTFIFKGASRANLIDEPSQSNQLSSNMKAAIHALQKGDRIIIDNIYVTTKSNKVSMAPTLVLTVN